MSDAVPVSVVVPCYRCSQTIGRAIASIAAQTRKPFEVILVDDASADNTAEALRKLAAAYKPGWIKLKLLDRNVGAASARNAGWNLATQPFIAFLDADDAWHPEKLEIQYGFMRVSPDVALSGHAHRLVEDEAAPAWPLISGSNQIIGKWRLLLSNRFVTPSVMVRNDTRHRFIENQRHMEDHMLWLQILFSGGKLVKLPYELTAIYKRSFGVAGLSAQLWSMEKAELGNYRRLRFTGFIKGYEYTALCIYSATKFARRLMIHWGRLRWTK